MAEAVTVADVVAYLGETAARWEDPDNAGVYPQIVQTLAAEAALQANKCTWVDTYPDPLRMALLRRVQRALAARQSPLGVAIDSNAGLSTYIPQWDAEIRRMEAPYRLWTGRLG